MSYKILLGDAIEQMAQLPDKCIDAVICDLPYGTTQCKWDSVINLEEMWIQIKRIRKSDGTPIIFTAAQPFTSVLVMSNVKEFKYSWIWEKSKATNYLNAKHQPMRAHEDILVFYKKPCTYNPQMVQGDAYDKGTAHRPTDVYGVQTATHVKSKGERYPRSVQYFITAESEGKLHPTQKPIKLMKYLVKTYTNENDVILDMTAGSFSTGVAAISLNRDFVGIELSPKYKKLGEQRMKEIPNANS